MEPNKKEKKNTTCLVFFLVWSVWMTSWVKGENGSLSEIDGKVLISLGDRITSSGCAPIPAHMDVDGEDGYLLNESLHMEAGNETNEFEESADGIAPFPLTYYEVQSLVSLSSITSKENKIKAVVNHHLDDIHRISSGIGGICDSQGTRFWGLPGIPISVYDFQLPKEKADLIVFFLPRMVRKNTDEELQRALSSLGNEPNIEGLHFIHFPESNRQQFLHYEKTGHGQLSRVDYADDSSLLKFPWYFNAPNVFDQSVSLDRDRFDTTNNIDLNPEITMTRNFLSYWTWPYFRCRNLENRINVSPPSIITPGRWLISYSVAFRGDNRFFGLLSFDVDLTHFPINQCELRKNGSDEERNRPMAAFHGTNKCDPKTTTCKFAENYPPGWFKGNYACVCKASHHALYRQWNNTIPGYKLESKWCIDTRGKPENETDSMESVSDSLQEMSSCHKCPHGCPDCIEKQSCMAESNYGFRLILLCISIIFSLGSLGLIFGVYHFRKSPIFSISSPIFLCITLFGCFVMNTEMVVLFPELSKEACIAVKWTRHLGFCITYTALYMKLCRVYLTFRVKSAHKIKLTEKHLLHWMSPIMVIMLLYLFAWTISDPPKLELMKTYDGKRLYQCVYNWWDHVLSVGEVIFLAYGVFICWRIRENHDAQFISYSIYNIALANVVMVTIHLLIMPKAGPDMKYLLAFIRTQLSTTVTIALVLGSKVYRAYRGDYPTLKQIANSANGFGGDVLDLGEENLQLKEELQKMAMQIERLKSFAMCKNNPHLKSNFANELDYGTLTTL